MNADPIQAKRIFLQALQSATPAQREALLQEACGGDDTLRQQVDLLLDAHEHADSFLEKGALAGGATVDQPLVEQPGTHIGPYRLVEKLGSGGMGVVFLAEQTEPVQRQVALKIIRPGMDTERVIARFEAERQALAVMDHPHVAKVLDAGTTESGRPFFVMELVHGQSITKYCNEHKLSVRDRLELFIPVCQAVQHAHQKGIIHRDLKPSNILVAEFDGRPVPKVIDFGVAKAIDQRAAQKQFSTQFGQIVGTLEYMSPEQARLNQNDVDTRSDVYSLGAVLYELLTGVTPFDRERLYSAAFDHALHIIDSEDPVKPSTRLSSSDSLPSIAALRVIEPQRLTGLIRGELDWIVMKALEKERSRRYDSASGLAQDIDHYLHDQPVLAGPPSAAYRFRKFARRNKRVLATVALMVLVMIVGTTVSVYQAVRATNAEQLAEMRLADVAQQRDAARTAEQQAEQAQQQAESVTNYLVDAFRSPNPEQDGRTITVAEILDRTVKDLESQFADQPLVKARLLNALGESYQGLGLHREAAGLFQEAWDIRQRVLGREHADTLESMNLLGLARLDAGRHTDAVATLEEVLQLRRAHQGVEDPDTLSSMNNLAAAYYAAGRPDEAVALHREVLELQRERLGKEHPDTLSAMNNLAAAGLDVGKYDEAIELLETTVSLRRTQLGADHPDTLVSMNNLANCYLNVGRHADALRLFKETLERMRARLGPAHSNTLSAMAGLAQAHLRSDQCEEGLGLSEESLQLARTHLGPAHPQTLQNMNNLASAYEDVGRNEEAITLQEEVLRLQREHLGGEHPNTLRSMNNLGLFYLRAKRVDEAIALLEQTCQLARKVLGPEHPSTLGSAQSLAGTYKAAGRYDEAIELAEGTLALERTLWGTAHPHVLGSTENLAAFYEAAGRHSEAVRAYEELASLERSARPGSAQLSGTLAKLNACLLQDKRYKEAEQCARECLTIRQQEMPDSWLTNNAQSILGRSLAAQERYAEAESLLLSGYQGLKEREETIPDPFKARVTEALDAIIELYEDWDKPETHGKWIDERHALWRETAHGLSERIERNPDDPQLYALRAEAWASCREWGKAEMDLRKVIGRTSHDARAWFALCIVQLSAGDPDAYRQVCQELVRYYLESPRPPLKGWEVTWCCRMAPIDEVELRHAVRLARESSAAAPNDDRVRHELACILYRAGNIEESARLQQEVWDGEPLYRPWAGLWLGMAYSRLGKVEEAEEYLAQAIELSKELTWNPYALLEYELLRREAEAVVAANSTDDAPAAERAPDVTGALPAAPGTGRKEA